MEAEDANGDVEDLWITLTSMGMNKALIMDEVSETGVRMKSLGCLSKSASQLIQ